MRKFTKLKTLLFLSYFLSSFTTAEAQYTELIPYRKGDEWGFSDRDRKEIIAYQFEEARFFVGDLAKVKSAGKWGLLDRDGYLFVPCQYDLIYGSSKDSRVVVCQGGDPSGHGGRWGFTSKYEGEPIALEYDLIRECDAPNLLGVNQGNQWGCINQHGKEVIPIQFEVENVQDHHFKEESYFESSLSPLKMKPSPPATPYLKIKFVDGLARVKLDGKWGFINTFGNAVIPLEYDFVGNFSEDLVCVIKQEGEQRKVGFVNQRNEMVIPLMYDVVPETYKLMAFKEGLVQVCRKGSWGYVNRRNQLVVPFRYGQAYPFQEGLALVNRSFSRLNPQWVFINSRGREVIKIPSDYQLLDEYFQEGGIRIMKKGKQGFLNEKGKVVGKIKYERVFPFQNGLAPVVRKLNGQAKLGFIDRRGREVIPLIYDYELNKTPVRWKYNLIPVKKDGKWGVINRRGKVVVDLIYEAIHYSAQESMLFQHGILAVKKEGKWGYINESGKVKIRFQYQQVRDFNDKGLAKVMQKGKWGYIDYRGLQYFLH